MDDTTLWINGTDNPRIMIEQMETVLEKYQDALNWTRGALSLPKCFHSVTHWKFHHNGLPYITDETLTLKIRRTREEADRIKFLTENVKKQGGNTLNLHQLQQAAGTRRRPDQSLDEYLRACNLPVEIPPPKSKDTQKSLGLLMASGGGSSGAEEKANRNGQTFGAQMSSSGLSKSDIIRALQSVHLPGHTYTFHGSPLSKKALNRTTNALITKLLPRLRYTQNHPIALRHAPINRGGLGLPHLYVEQGVTNIKQMLFHIRLKTSLGILMLVNLSWTQLHTGMSQSILIDTSTPLPHVANSWWIRQRAFLTFIGGTLKMESSHTPGPLRCNNTGIMQHVLGLNLPPQTVRCFNACRFYLQVTYTSEIVHPNGKSLLPAAFQGDKKALDRISRSTNKWPRQTRPNKKSFNLWRSIIKQCTCTGIH